MYDGCCPFPVKLAPFTAIPAWAEGFTAPALKILSCAETQVNSMQVWETSGAGGEQEKTHRTPYRLTEIPKKGGN